MDADNPNENALTRELQSALGVSESFLASLGEDEDWPFVVKIHALMESAINHLIISKLADPRLKKFVSRLETSNPQSGKLAIVKSLELLPPNLQRFMVGLSTLRNTFVHDVRNLHLTLNQCIDSMPTEKAKECRSALKAHLKDQVAYIKSTGTQTFTSDAFVFEFPRMTIMFAVIGIASIACRGSLPVKFPIVGSKFVLPTQSNPKE